MANQLQITGDTRVKSLTGVLIGTTGLVSSLNIDGSLGIPQLDVNGKILVSQLPNSVMEYKGTWDAATNTPTLANGTGDQGDVYLCSVAGTVNFGAGAIAFVISDQVIYSGSIWQKASGTNGTVTSVASSITGNAIGLSGSPITTAGTLAFAFAGTNLQYVNGAGDLTTFPILTGYVTSVSGTAPVVSSGGTTPVISMAAATGSVDGYLSATDFAIFNAKQSALTFSSPLVNTSGVISIPVATTSVNGYLASADFTTFNNKQNAITLTTTGTSGASTLVGATLNIPNYAPDLSGYVTLAGTQTITGAKTFSGYTTFTSTVDITSGLTFSNSGFTLVLQPPTLSVNRTVTLPNGTGTLALTSQLTSGTVTSVAALTLGTSGTDLSSTVATSTTTPVITLNVPTASASNRGALSSADWTTFNSKQGTITLTTTGTSGAATLISNTLNIPNYGSALSGYVPYTGATGAVNLGAYDLTVNTITVGRGGGTVATNTALGYQAGNGANSGSGQNTFIGYQSGKTNTTGSENVFLGYSSGFLGTTGIANVGLGNYALYSLVGAYNYNVAIGYITLGALTTGANNVALGGQAGRFISGGSTALTIANNSIFIGYNTKALANNQTNQTVIGYDATGLGSNTTVIGNSSTTDTAIYGRMLVNYSTPVIGSYALDVNGTARVQGQLTISAAQGLATITSTTGTNYTGVVCTNTGGSWYNVIDGATPALGDVAYAQVNYYGGNTYQLWVTAKKMLVVNGNGGNFDVGTGGGISASSGTNTRIALQVAPTYNLTGTFTGAVIGIYYNPTLTSLTGTTHTAFQNVTGNNLFGTTSGSVGIGVNTSINASAILDITSTTKGFLQPRMTTTQRNAIATPATGLQVYNTTTNTNDFYNGTAWGSNAPSSLYLPLTGGTLTGPLSGTSASFSTGINITGNGGFFNAANKFGLDQNGGAARFYSSGGDASTKGSYEFHTSSSNGSLDVIALGIASTGAATFSSSVTVGNFTTVQKNALTGVAGMVVYDTTLNKLCVYTTAWETITSI